MCKLQNCNFGNKLCVPVGKIIKNKYIAIFFYPPVDAAVVDLSTFDLKGTRISTINYFSANDYGFDRHICNVKMDKECKIIRIDSTITVDSNNNQKKAILVKDIYFKILDNGKIVTIK